MSEGDGEIRTRVLTEQLALNIQLLDRSDFEVLTPTVEGISIDFEVPEGVDPEIARVFLTTLIETVPELLHLVSPNGELSPDFVSGFSREFAAAEPLSCGKNLFVFFMCFHEETFPVEYQIVDTFAQLLAQKLGLKINLTKKIKKDAGEKAATEKPEIAPFLDPDRSELNMTLDSGILGRGEASSVFSDVLSRDVLDLNDTSHLFEPVLDDLKSSLDRRGYLEDARSYYSKFCAFNSIPAILNAGLSFRDHHINAIGSVFALEALVKNPEKVRELKRSPRFIEAAKVTLREIYVCRRHHLSARRSASSSGSDPRYMESFIDRYLEIADGVMEILEFIISTVDHLDVVFEAKSELLAKGGTYEWPDNPLSDMEVSIFAETGALYGVNVLGATPEIPETDKEKIFDSFPQLDQLRERGFRRDVLNLKNALSTAGKASVTPVLRAAMDLAHQKGTTLIQILANLMQRKLKIGGDGLTVD